MFILDLDKEIVDQEIERLRAIDCVREKVHKQKMKGFGFGTFYGFRM